MDILEVYWLGMAMGALTVIMVLGLAASIVLTRFRINFERKNNG